MKILFNTHSRAFQNPGGGEIQLLKTKEHLEKEGIKVKNFNKFEDKIKDYDILHNFTTLRDCYDTIRYAYQNKIPIALSTIWWPPSIGYALKSNQPFTNKLKTLGYIFINKYNLFKLSKVKEMMEMTNILLPNSKIEGGMITKHFGIKQDKIHPVPNGVDDKFAKANSKLFQEKYGLKDFILYVGRIEPIKNVLSLIKAVRDKPIVIIGEAPEDQKSYKELCKKEASKNIKFLGKINHNDPLLESAYASCDTLVLPSWHETTGLVALEAGLAGAKIVITSRGATKEYFKNYVEYINPANTKDIKEKIEVSLKKEKTNELKNHILNNYLWKHVALKTKEAYEKILLF